MSNKNKPLTYAQAGVDKEAGYEAVKRMKSHVARTMRPEVLTALGGFGGGFSLPTGYKEPVLVSGTDGVGTKLKLAFAMDKHDTVGIDCVAMCVNDILCQGAEPLFFLDYIAVGKNVPEKIEAIVAGVAEGCVQSNSALVGGETAEMPGMYDEDEYDMAGFSVGVVEKERMITGENIAPGNIMIGLPSSGLHSNGFSLFRKVVEHAGVDWDAPLGDGPQTIGQAALTPTRIYVKPVLKLLESVTVKGMCHITGGGLYENVPRVLPEDCDALVDFDAIPKQEIFSWIQEAGGIALEEMIGTFNMGVGFVLILGPDDADKTMAILRQAGESPFLLGTIAPGSQEVKI
jgi:phosphoribosylformylglycinamidine cyclo-ligase